METQRLQPQAVELEEAVLGALLQDKEAINSVASIIDEDSFYDNKHKLVYSAIMSLYEEDKPIDILTVKEKLEKDGNLNAVGGAYFVVKLSSKVVSSAHVEYHASIVQQKAKSRMFINSMTSLLSKAYDPSEDIADILSEAELNLFDISSKGIVHDFINARDVVKDVYDEINRAASMDGKLTGLETGLRELDKITGGLQSPDLIIVAARPAMGKTALGLTIAKHIALEKRIPTGFFSLEMSNQQLVKRTTSIIGSIESSKLRDGSLNEVDWENMDRGLGMILDGQLWLDDTASLNIMEFRSKARRMVRDCGVKLIIIDYLQLMTARVRGNRQEEVGYISRSLKATAKELDIPIIALAQLNRETESRDGAAGKRPRLSDLRESGSIEQDADIVMAIHRPEYYGITQDDKGMDLHNVAELIMLKHRNGALGDMKLGFKGEYTRFENLGDEITIPLPPINNAPF